MNHLRSHPHVVLAMFACSFCTGSRLAAQAASVLNQSASGDTIDARSISSSLPDAPGYAPETATPPKNPNDTQAFRFIEAPKYAQIIEPEYVSVDLKARDKVAYAGRKVFSLQFPVGVLISAGLSQGFGSDPTYGNDATAFAKKVGAAGARGASQIIFSDGILAPILHEDPRYYVLGPQHSFSGRALYAATRVFITRNDKGANTLNLADLAGYGGSAAMTQLYYPSYSRDTRTMLSTYGSSLLGLAIQNEIGEFFRFFVPHQPKP